MTLHPYYSNKGRSKRMSECTDDMKFFMNLTDDVIQRILGLELTDSEQQTYPEKSIKLEKVYTSNCVAIVSYNIYPPIIV